MMSGSEKGQPKAVVVGGSIAGISCAHALLSAGWQVVVVEKSVGPTSGSPTGAGLGLDPLVCNIINSWLGHSALLNKATLPLTFDQNQVTNIDKKITRTLTRDEEFNFRAAHWADLHGLLLGSLPSEIFLWGHQFLSFCISDDKNTVTVKAKILKTGEITEIAGDLLVAADGCLSSIRQTFLPNHKLRYAGYCAWRGVLDFSGNHDSETIRGIRRVYPDLGKCLYFDLGPQTHCVFYELLNKRMNWIWYINQPEPDIKASSVTLKVSKETIKQMQEDAEKIWVPELVALMKATEEPFVNVIYDSDPLADLAFCMGSRPSDDSPVLTAIPSSQVLTQQTQVTSLKGVCPGYQNSVEYNTGQMKEVFGHTASPYDVSSGSHAHASSAGGNRGERIDNHPLISSVDTICNKQVFKGAIPRLRYESMNYNDE